MKNITESVKKTNRPEKVLQFGEGNFLRAFVDWKIDIANEKTDFNSSVVLVQPIERGMKDMINQQNGLYTTILRGVQNGKTVEEVRTITCVSRCLNPYSDFDEYMKCAENPDLRFIVSNTTEAGIAYAENNHLNDKPPATFPAKVTAFLFRRFEHFKGAKNKGLVFIPCELIEKNGDKLKEIVLRYANEWKLSAEFIEWIQDSNDFCNSLVDRIVTGYPKEEAEALCKKIGYTDNLLNAAEVFHLWVIETKKDHSKDLPLAKAGLNVIWTDDMTFYRTRKVRILNGAHTMMVPAAFQFGLNTVEECMHDKTVSEFLRKGLFEEIIPSMSGNIEELKKYAADVLERFANPYIKHLLLSITLNSVSKFKTRDLPSITEYVAKTGKIPNCLVFSLAALISFYEGTQIKDGALIGSRNGEEYQIKDDLAVLEYFAALYKETEQKSAQEKARFVAPKVLSNVSWWGQNLTEIKGFENAVVSALESIWTKGMKTALLDAVK